VNIFFSNDDINRERTLFKEEAIMVNSEDFVERIQEQQQKQEKNKQHQGNGNPGKKKPNKIHK